MQQFQKAERLYAAHKERLAGGRPTTAGTMRGSMTMGLNDRDEMNQYIPGFNESSPRTQSEKMSDYLMQLFREKSIMPARIFAMADSHRSNSVKFSLILEAMIKTISGLSRDFVDQIPAAFGMSSSDVLTRQDFDLMFDVKA